MPQLTLEAFVRSAKPSTSAQPQQQKKRARPASPLSSSKKANGAKGKARDDRSDAVQRDDGAHALRGTLSAANARVLAHQKDGTGAIWHSDLYSRTMHMQSCVTGHQRGEARAGGGCPSSYYAKERMEKLSEQALKPENTLLRGVVAYINGYTGDVTNLQLVDMIHKAGGKTCLAYSSKTSHVLAHNGLSARKIQLELDKRRMRCKFVSPQWIIDSIAMGKRQPEARYAVITNDDQASVYDQFAPSSSCDTSVKLEEAAVEGEPQASNREYAEWVASMRKLDDQRIRNARKLGRQSSGSSASEGDSCMPVSAQRC